MHDPTDPSSTSDRQVLVVAGSGRSGTSLFTGLTGRLGFHIPKPEVAANKSNPRGFGEPRWAVDFHNELLASADVVVEDGRPEAWDATSELAKRPEVVARLQEWLEEQFAESDRVVVKDPRLAWFFELYRVTAAELGADLHVATMLRDPAEVLKSREIAYGTRTVNTTRTIGWINMMLGIERRTRDLPRATIRYTDLLDDWHTAFATADRTLGTGLIERATPEQIAEAGELVDPNLRRSVTSLDDLGLGSMTRDLTTRVYDAYGRLVGAEGEAQTAVRAELDALTDEFTAFYDECFDVARNRTGATARRERRKGVRKVREELTAAHAAELEAAREAQPSGLRGRIGSIVRGGRDS
ncbi:hypothetical protein ABLE68_05810 [Nocardioides sp. CN2-186]|uniref:sulfotransferase family protein n=1 Tax=Nocardioides tweenelious TaxID=3156607 RepID=UPI0032B330C3